MGWEWVLVIGIILVAIAIIIAIIIFSGQSSDPRPPVIDTGTGDGNGNGNGNGGSNPGSGNSNGGGTNLPPDPTPPGDDASTCTDNSDCANNNCSKGFCQPTGTVTGTICIGNVCALCSKTGSGPTCDANLTCTINNINQGTGVCVAANGQFGDTCDGVSSFCTLPLICGANGSCQFNNPPTAAVSGACPTNFILSANNCLAPAQGLCLDNTNCASGQCNQTTFCSRWVINTTGSNYLNWVPTFNPMPTVTQPAILGRMEVTSDRTEAWLYIDSVVSSTNVDDPLYAQRSVQYWNQSLGQWTIAQGWRYDNLFTFSGTNVTLYGRLRGITMSRSDRCYVLFDAILPGQGIFGFCIFQIIPNVNNNSVTFSLQPYNTPPDGIPGMQADSPNTVLSNVQCVSSTTYNNQDYMLIYATGSPPGSTQSRLTPFVRDINNLSSPYYISSGSYFGNNQTDLEPSYYFAAGSSNPLLDYAIVNYNQTGSIVSLTYSGTINKTIEPPSFNQTSNQISTYRHMQLNAKTALVMLYRPLGSDNTPTVGTLAINSDVTQGNQAESFPGYIASDASILAPNIQAIYVATESRCN